jgi:hypothetical protein
VGAALASPVLPEALAQPAAGAGQGGGAGKPDIQSGPCAGVCPDQATTATAGGAGAGGAQTVAAGSQTPCAPEGGAAGGPRSWTLQTDGGVTVRRTIRTDAGAVDNPTRFEKHKTQARVGQGGYVLQDPRTGYNCHGFTFDRGGSEVEGEDVDKILQDGYSEIPVQKCESARLCDVIVWRAGVIDHSGLVIAVDANNKPTMVASKFGPTGGLFAHAPDAWASDWEIHRRKAMPPPATIGPAMQAWGQAQVDHATGKGTIEDVYRRAAELCQIWNGLTRQ